MDTDPQTVTARERIGQVLTGKWRLERLLGVGGMAAVYEASHRNGKRVAVKVLHPSLSGIKEARDRFRREGYAANAVHHPGVVSVLDDDESEAGEAFLVMDLLEGETLEARWTRCGLRLPVREVLALAEGVLDVLRVAHEAGVVHRDIKPENIFVTPDGSIRILDFGIARVQSPSPLDHRTQAGVAMGTPAFMPPEQARGRWDAVGARSDLWAVGAVMFCLLTGRLVHDAATTNEVLLAAMTAQAPRLLTLCPDMSASVAEIVDGALAFEPGDRWPDAASMLAAVRQALAGIDDASSTSLAPGPLGDTRQSALGPSTTRLGCAGSIPSPARSPWWGRRALAVAGGAVVVGLAVLAGALGGQGRSMSVDVRAGAQPVPSSLADDRPTQPQVPPAQPLVSLDAASDAPIAVVDAPQLPVHSRPRSPSVPSARQGPRPVSATGLDPLARRR